MRRKEQMKIKNIIYRHLENNSKEYILVTLVFIVGIFLGVMFINNVQETQMSDITSYLNDYIDKLKNIENLNNLDLLKVSIFQNITLALVLWFFGTTVIRNTNCVWSSFI